MIDWEGVDHLLGHTDRVNILHCMHNLDFLDTLRHLDNLADKLDLALEAFCRTVLPDKHCLVHWHFLDTDLHLVDFPDIVHLDWTAQYCYSPHA